VFPIVRPEDLPSPGTSTELPELDFKSTVNTADSIELAKDVAALANTVGGSILVGASAQGQRLVAYRGVTEPLARQAAQGYEQAVKDRCRPTPYLETRILTPAAGTTVLAVNVWLSPVAPIGVRIRQDLECPARLVDEAWVFPRRVGSQTTYLQPDQFGAFENMTARRATALLLRIPEHERKSIRLQSAGDTMPPGGFPLAYLLEVSLDRNFARFNLGNPLGDNLKPLCVPIDWVHTAWRNDSHNEWHVVLDAALELAGDHWVAHPT